MNGTRQRRVTFKRVQAAIARRWPVNATLQPTPARTILLAGAARGGTTWTARLMNPDNRYRYLFEPFDPTRVDAVSKFAYRQYLRPYDRTPSLLSAAKAVVCGRIRDPWIDQLNTRVFARHLLVKDVRVNLMLAWLKTNFPDLRIVLLLRHPGAVADSRLRLGWHHHLDDLLAQRELVEDHLAPHVARFRNERSPFQQHVLLWCVETLVPLTELRPYDVHVMFYEHLYASPDNELARLSAFLGEPLGRDGAAFDQPTVVSRSDSPIRQGADPLRSWKRAISREEQLRMAETLDAFGLGHVYGTDPLPLHADGNALLTAAPSALP